jgi:DnaJ like chaperone protein
MSIWTEIGVFLTDSTSEVFSSLVEKVRTVFAGDAETRKRVAFSIAIIALSAKMAKADGIVTENEIDAFRQIFEVPNDELENVARLFNLARKDVAGFDAYARQVKSLFPKDQEVLRDVLDGLFHIAKADDILHEKELEFIEHVAVVFEFDEKAFERIKMRHMSLGERDPYLLLDADPDWDFDKLKAHYRKRAAANHPDRLIARGVPPEFIAIATDRLASINSAWEQIELERKPLVRA